MMEDSDDHLKYKPNKLCGICGDKALGKYWILFEMEKTIN